MLGTGNDGGQCLFPVSHARIVGRYYQDAPLVHSCINGKCPCDPNHAPEIETDSITAVDPKEFAVTKWKLIECGSSTPTCSGDIVPAAPIRALCENLRTGPNAGTCEDDSMPNDTHLECHVTGVEKCRAWFDALAR